MTTAEMLFGSGDLAPTNAAWGRRLGLTRQTIGKKKEYPGTITLDELAQIAFEKDMTAEQVGQVVLAWRRERTRARVSRRRDHEA